MLSALLICSLLAAPPTDKPPDDGATYDAARARAGRDPEAHVQLALWCEAHGMNSERMKHLAIAVLTDPKNAMARGLMGLVAYKGQWQRPDVVGEKIKADPELSATVAEYLEKRAKTPLTADAQWRLAVWCDDHGLIEESQAHLRTVIRLDPKREAAWKRLGYELQGKRWVLARQLAAEKEEQELQKKADRRWKLLLEKWRGWLGDRARRADAEKAIAGVVDPRAVPMVWQVFATGGADRQAIAAQVFSQIDAPGASRALTALAVFSESAEVRRAAAESLQRRDAREFAGLLVNLIRDTVKYEVKHVAPGAPGELFIKGTKTDLKRVYKSSTASPDLQLQPGDRIVFDANGYPVIRRAVGEQSITPLVPLQSLIGFQTQVPSPLNVQQQQQLLGALARSPLGAQGRQIGQTAINNFNSFGPMGFGLNPFSQAMFDELALRPPTPITRLSFGIQPTMDIPVGRMTEELEKAALSSEQQLEEDVKKLENYNTSVRKFDDRLLAILRQAAGQDLGEDREPWEVWWNDLIGYRIMAQKSQENSLVVEDISPAYQPQQLEPTVGLQVRVASRMSCFAAGTLVRTRLGSQAIETLRVGDVVLTQSIKTGSLGYHAIEVVHHNPPSKTYRVALGREVIVSSAFHRFWKAGSGWVMARDLKAGDTIRTLGGLVKVESMHEGPAEPVFNLDVAEDNDFFVGKHGALVHDNSLPDLRLAPFDAAPPLTAAATRPQ